MPRFVVLQHEHPRGRHWDFMLETGDVLATWALSAPPDESGPIAAERLPDHRRAYLDYEGPVSGDRGTVSRWDAGTYTLLHQDENEVAATLMGKRIAGHVRFVRSADEPEMWRLTVS